MISHAVRNCSITSKTDIIPNILPCLYIKQTFINRTHRIQCKNLRISDTHQYKAINALNAASDTEEAAALYLHAAIVQVTTAEPTPEPIPQPKLLAEAAIPSTRMPDSFSTNRTISGASLNSSHRTACLNLPAYQAMAYLQHPPDFRHR